jgi:urease accessory protein
MPHVLVERILGTIDAFPTGSRRIERALVSSDDLAKRILRVRTSVGDLGIRLGPGALHEGDVIFANDDLVVCVAVEADDVLVAHLTTVAQAAEIGHALGNRHLPMQQDGDALVVRFDPLVEELFRERGVAYTREQRRLREPFRHAHAPHGHA